MEQVVEVERMEDVVKIINSMDNEHEFIVNVDDCFGKSEEDR